MGAGLITTEAWVLHRRRPARSGVQVPMGLSLERYSFDDLDDHEVLVAPLYGCWEANMSHALERVPVDICRQRHEERVVVGNSGVVRVLETGAAVTSVREGDICVWMCMGVSDDAGYVQLVHGYDAPGSVGLLAKRTKIHERYLATLPADTPYSLAQWSASARYWTAWSNWKVAHGCWRTQMDERDQARPYVWGWGGGVAFAQLDLATRFGCRTAMIASTKSRLQRIRDKGITAIDRREFPDLWFDEQRAQTDRAYRNRYRMSEHRFLSKVRDVTDGAGVSIFIDNIGAPVYRATLRALARQGVITTVGWKHGMKLQTMRANECIQRHIHVHTHAARDSDVREMMAFQDDAGWMPTLDGEVYGWDEIPVLAEDYAHGKIDTYFPIYRVNDV